MIFINPTRYKNSEGQFKPFLPFMTRPPAQQLQSGRVVIVFRCQVRADGSGVGHGEVADG